MCTACAQLWMNPTPYACPRWSSAGKDVDKRNLRLLGVSRRDVPPGVFADAQRTAAVGTVNSGRPGVHGAGNDHRIGGEADESACRNSTSVFRLRRE